MLREEGYYIYRLPGEDSYNAAAGEFKKGLHADGFVVSPFDSTLLPTLTIRSGRLLDLDSFPFEELERVSIKLYEETSPKVYRESVSYIISQLKEGEKCVFSRYISNKKQKIDLRESFINLSRSFPQGMVFCFYIPSTGCWIGASPELLLKKEGNIIHTMALAGTRPSHSKPEPWDDKNIEEQEIVTRYITEVLGKHCYSVTILDPPSTQKVGSIEHLRTDIKAIINHKNSDAMIGNLLDDLAPTPALCGYPKEKARKLIFFTEPYPREYYGGFFGPFHSNGDLDLYVLLRSLKVGEEGWSIYAGGGITSHSVPVEEYRETQRKADSILKFVSFKSDIKN